MGAVSRCARLQRRGQQFRAFYGINGYDWTTYAPPRSVSDLPATLLVGLMACSQNTNQTTVAEFRGFGDFVYTNCAITFTEQPRDVTQFQAGSVSFSATVHVSGAPAEEVMYQWQRSDDRGETFADIPNARRSTYTKQYVFRDEDDGDLYRVVTTASGCAATSSVALLTVPVECFPLYVRYVVSVNGTNVSVYFSAPVPLSAGDRGFYSIPGIDIIGAQRHPTNFARVDIRVSNATPFVMGNAYTITISGVTNFCGFISPNPTTNRFIAWITYADPDRYPVLPDNHVLSTGTLTNRGFDLRFVQIPVNIAGDIDVAEWILAGTLINPYTAYPYPNFAPIPCYFETNLINYSSRINAGYIVPDQLFPGYPSRDNENLVMEILTWLELESGFHQWRVYSYLQQFQITSAAGADDPNNNIIIGQEAGGRIEETFVGFIAPRRGLYPIRMVWFDFRGGGDIEWTKFDPVSGSRIAINGSESTKALRPPSSLPPELRIHPSDSGLIVTWPGLAIGYCLESSGSLGETNSWSIVREGIVSAYGMKSVTVPVSGSQRFYRLIRR